MGVMTPAYTEDQIRASVAERYEKYVGRADSGCWTWNGPTKSNGYGKISTGRTGFVYAHRWAVEAALGQPIPDGLHVCHTCDNPPCTNPAHLFLGTNADNAADARAKGLRIKPTCRRGHPKTIDNTYTRFDRRGYIERHCRTCAKERRAA